MGSFGRKTAVLEPVAAPAPISETERAKNAAAEAHADALAATAKRAPDLIRDQVLLRI
jgi:hypothetical protein